MTEFDTDEQGFPVFLAVRQPGQVAAQPDNAGAVLRGASSGNPNADVASGRFTGKGSDKANGAGSNGSKVVKQTQAQKANVDPVALERRKDLVRRAASLMDEMNMGDASKWLEQFGVDVNSARVDTFLADVRAQRVDYLVDAMVPELRTVVDAHKQGQVVQLKVPKSWSSAVLNNLTDAEFTRLHQRLAGQGFDAEDVAKNLVKRIKNKTRREQLGQVFGEGGTK